MGYYNVVKGWVGVFEVGEMDFDNYVVGLSWVGVIWDMEYGVGGCCGCCKVLVMVFLVGCVFLFEWVELEKVLKILVG